MKPSVSLVTPNGRWNRSSSSDAGRSDRRVGRWKLVRRLKRSQFLVGLARALRGLVVDFRVVVWSVERNSKIADYIKAHPVKKLQLGTSNNVLDGWLNTDVFVNHDSIIYLDATRPFPFKDNTFDYIIAEHIIEHVEYAAAQVMLRECFRVLKPGGRVRIATPDLNVVLSLYSREKTESQIRYIDWAVARFTPEAKECQDIFVINNLFRAWGHQFLYNAETLYSALSAGGFDEIKFYKPGASEDPNLESLESHGREIESEEVNQFETIVVEGLKRR